jgi:hypothetical protein
MESGGTLRNKWGVKAQELLKVGASEFIWGPCWKRTCGRRSVTQEDWNSERKMSRGVLTRRRPKWEQGTNLDRWSRWAHGTRSIAPATNHSGEMVFGMLVTPEARVPKWITVVGCQRSVRLIPCPGQIVGVDFKEKGVNCTQNRRSSKSQREKSGGYSSWS